MSNYGTDSGNTQPPQQPPEQPPAYQPPAYQPPPQQEQPPQMYQQPPQMGMPVAPPKRRSPLLIIGIIIVVLLVVCGGGFAVLGGVILNATQPIVDAGNVYMGALRDGDFNKAFNLSTPTLQQQVSDAAGLQAALGTKQVDTWSFDSRNINNNLGEVMGTTKYKDGSSGTVDLQFNKIGNDWKASYVLIK